MVRLAANLTMLFDEAAFPDRFAAAAAAGFGAVEFQLPYAYPAALLAERCRAAGLRTVLFNLPPGDWAAGERGLACLAGRERDFAESVEQGLAYAAALDCPTLHVMAGMPAAGRWVVIEPLNARDVPGYLLRTTEEAAAVIAAVGRPNLGLQLDLYHCQIAEGDLTMRIRRLRPLIRHVQIAGVPDRHEPDSGEFDPHFVLGALDATGYAGWVGCEYRPRGDTVAGLGWARRYLPARAG